MATSGIKEDIVQKELNLIAIQHVDGRFSKGYTNDFSPTIPFFHLAQIAEKSTDEGKKIYFDTIKLIDFSQSVEDNYFEKSDPCSPTSCPAIEVTFKDGEVLQGMMIDSRPNGFGFFLSVNQDNRKRKVFLVDSAIQRIRDVK